MSNTIVKVIEDLNGAFEEFKKTNDERLEAEAKGSEARTRELTSKLDSIESEITDLSKKKKELEAKESQLKERVELLEAVNDRPRGTIQDKINDEYKSAFEIWMRSGGKDREAEQENGHPARRWHRTSRQGSSSVNAAWNALA